MSEWQPIETAPRDGTAILGFWCPVPGGQVRPNCEVRPDCYAVTRYELGEWLDVDNDDETYSEPTHWMPLPDPPDANNVPTPLARELVQELEGED